MDLRVGILSGVSGQFEDLIRYTQNRGCTSYGLKLVIPFFVLGSYSHKVLTNEVYTNDLAQRISTVVKPKELLQSVYKRLLVLSDADKFSISSLFGGGDPSQTLTEFYNLLMTE